MVTLDIWQVMFGNSYIYDRNALYYRRAQNYALVKDGKTFMLDGTGSGASTSLATIAQAKRLFQAGGQMLMLLVREKEAEVPLGEVVAKELAEGARKQAKELLWQHAELFAEPRRPTPRRAIEHSIALVDGAPLPNACLYRHSLLESEEIKRQV